MGEVECSCTMEKVPTKSGYFFCPHCDTTRCPYCYAGRSGKCIYSKQYEEKRGDLK